MKTPRRPRPTRRPTPIPRPRQQHSPRPARDNRIHVTFYCLAGQESSFLAKKTFEKLLADKKLSRRFRVNYEGTRNYSTRELRTLLSRTDYAIGMFPTITAELKQHGARIQNQHPRPKIVDVAFNTIHDQTDPHKYHAILQQILANESQRTKQRN